MHKTFTCNTYTTDLKNQNHKHSKKQSQNMRSIKQQPINASNDKAKKTSWMFHVKHPRYSMGLK